MMGEKDSSGPGRRDGKNTDSVSGGAGTGPGRNESQGRDGNQSGRGTGSGKSK